MQRYFDAKARVNKHVSRGDKLRDRVLDRPATRGLGQKIGQMIEALASRTVQMRWKV
jgi:hypothetical protein